MQFGAIFLAMMCIAPFALSKNADAAGGSWTTKSPMPTARTHVASVEINGVIYVVGGFTSPGFTAVGTLEAYDTQTDTWSTKLSPMPTARGELSVAAVNGILYAIGGEVGGASYDVVEAYDPATDSWTTKAPMPSSRYGSGVGVVNGVIYVIGGLFGAPFQNPIIHQTVEAYNPATDSWSTKAPMPTARWLVSATVSEGVIYIAGGNLNSFTITSAFEAYDPVANQWMALPSMPTARNLPGTGALRGDIIVAGGGNVNGNGVSAVESFDVCSQTWSTKSPLPTARYGVGSSASNGTLLIIGGATAAGATKFDTVEAFRICNGACAADIAPSGGNDVVDVDDLLTVINAWGACP